MDLPEQIVTMELEKATNGITLWSSETALVSSLTKQAAF